MNMGKLFSFLIPLLGTLSAPAAAQHADLAGSDPGFLSDRQLWVGTAQTLCQWYLENRLWRVWRKRVERTRTGRPWASDDYDLAGVNIYIPLDYGGESWSLRPR
jgi:hypothetical protein